MFSVWPGGAEISDDSERKSPGQRIGSEHSVHGRGVNAETERESAGGGDGGDQMQCGPEDPEHQHLSDKRTSDDPENQPVQVHRMLLGTGPKQAQNIQRGLARRAPARDAQAEENCSRGNIIGWRGREEENAAKSVSETTLFTICVWKVAQLHTAEFRLCKKRDVACVSGVCTTPCRTGRRRSWRRSLSATPSVSSPPVSSTSSSTSTQISISTSQCPHLSHY